MQQAAGSRHDTFAQLTVYHKIKIKISTRGRTDAYGLHFSSMARVMATAFKDEARLSAA
jgi:hypothetical protein